jgi:hypothetical protein
MGIERTVTLWYLHRQTLLNELASLEARLVQMRPIPFSEAVPSEAKQEASPIPTELVEIETEYKRVQEKLRNLGPCPHPMMG